MGIFNRIFGIKKKERKSGVYIIENGELRELEEHPGDGSINAISKELGFDTNQVHTVMTFNSKLTMVVGFKIFTKMPLFAVTRDGIADLKHTALIKEVKKIDWDFEYSATQIEDTLTSGVNNRNLSLDFLNTVTKLSRKSEGTYHAPELELFLIFEDGVLRSFTSTDGFTSETKYFKNLNPTLFDSMMSEASHYQSSQKDALFEINEQFKALMQVPEATNNPNMNDHKTERGNYNFFNLLAAHYSAEVTIEKFKIINKGRYTRIADNKLKVGLFYYEFDKEGILKKSWK